MLVNHIIKQLKIKRMKATRTTKRWMLTSLLFLSLTVYAAAPNVTISNIIVENITSTTADLTFAYAGASEIRFYATYFEYGEYHFVTSTATPNEGFNYMTYYLAGFTPGTTYYIRVDAVVYDSDGNKYDTSSYVNFTTLME